jgi:hypothetical protein
VRLFGLPVSVIGVLAVTLHYTEALEEFICVRGLAHNS